MLVPDEVNELDADEADRKAILALQETIKTIKRRRAYRRSDKRKALLREHGLQ